MFPRSSFFVLIVMLAHLGRVRADNLISQIANGNLMQEVQEMQEMQKRMVRTVFKSVLINTSL